jgi:methylenetetrahydrofolate reductase (NADPH)
MNSGKLQTLLAAGHFVVSAELTPPRHYNAHFFMARANQIKPHVDVVQVNDNALAQARLSNLVAAHLLQQAGLEAVVQFSLRHRNRIALQGDLLGLAALGIRNIIILSGYPCSMGSDPDAKDATDMDPVSAIAALNQLTQSGQLFNGDIIKPPPKFYVGTIASPQAKNITVEESVNCLAAKIEQGAKYVQLQAVLELEPLERWMAEVRARKLHHRAHFLASMYPFRSVRALECLTRLPGVTIPDPLMTRLSRSRDTQADCVEITLELAEGISRIEGIRGLHLRSQWLGDGVQQISERLRSVCRSNSVH